MSISPLKNALLLAAIATLALGLASCLSESSEPPVAKVVKAAPPAPPAQDAPPPVAKPAPPPLIEVKDPDEGKVEVFVPIIREREAEKKAPPLVERENVFWRYIDGSGAAHVTDDPAAIPRAYRASASKIERLPTRIPSAEGQAVTELMDQNGTQSGSIWEKREKACAAFKTRAREAKERLEAAAATYAMEKNSPPECGGQVVLGLGSTYDTDCESHWRNRIDVLRKNQERAQNALSNLQDEARRADVPPGCVR